MFSLLVLRKCHFVECYLEVVSLVLRRHGRPVKGHARQLNRNLKASVIDSESAVKGVFKLIRRV